jgi:hypothetical protein
MRPYLIAGGLLLVSGLVSLAMAPQAASCVQGSDYYVCETSAVIVLNVLGTMLLAVGVMLLAVSRRATR